MNTQSTDSLFHIVRNDWFIFAACWFSFINVQPPAVALDDVLLDAEVIALSGTPLFRPTAIAVAPGDPDAVYVAEIHDSRVRRVDLNTGAITDFLDMPNLPFGGEIGLKGLAFHPDYATNGRFYVHEYDGNDINILEFTHTGSNTNPVSLATEKSVLSFTHIGISDSHTAGWIGFSPFDDYLYIPAGDGGAGGCAACGLPAQDLNDLRGKILRIDVDSDDFPADSVQNYGIPAENPFSSGGGAPEILAYGVRSPFSATIDSLNGDFYVADVGSVFYEEVNRIPVGTSGQNFGWRTKEGPFDNPTFSDPIPANVVDPIHFYAHEGGAAIIGGNVYRGTDIPWLYGHYIFSDFVMGAVGTFDTAGGVVSDLADHTDEFANFGGIVGYTEGLDGEIYFIRRFNSAIYKLTGSLRGDFDRDGQVDLDDLSQWEGDYGINGDSDADGDGDSDGADFLIWQRQINDPSLFSAAISVPEPKSWLMLLCFIVSLVGLRNMQ